MSLVVLVLFVSWCVVRTTEASIDYWLELEESFPTGLNSISVYCKNVGESDGVFKLRLDSINAIFSNQTELPYEMVNDSTVTVQFSLNKGESQQKKIYFTVSETMKSFKLNLSCEKISLFLRSNPKHPTELIYSWLAQENVFMRNVPMQKQ